MVWGGVFPGGVNGKEPACQCRWHRRLLGWEDPLEEGMATHSSILVWRSPWTEEPSGLQSIGSQRVGHDWATWYHHHKQGTKFFLLSLFPSILLLIMIFKIHLPVQLIFFSLVKYLTSLKATTKSCSFSFPIDHLLCNKHLVKCFLDEYCQS